MNAHTRQNSTDPRPSQSSTATGFPTSSARHQHHQQQKQQQQQQHRSRGSRGARRTASSAAGKAAAAEERAQKVNDPAARQQLKQTMSISMIANPAFPLPFPLQVPLGLTTLLCPDSSTDKKRAASQGPSERG